jgi:uncharacterized protein
MTEKRRMKQPGRFLTAEWINVVMLNYSVDPSLLQPSVPAGTELDEFEGHTYMSLVGFEFNRTRVLGIAAPFHRSFEEVNLRFYVRRSSRRGVVFIRELVPRFAVAAIARSAFGENYSCVPMSHSVRQSSEGEREVEYSWASGPHLCTMRIRAEGRSFHPVEGSLTQFITEHYWGYTAQSHGGSLEYEVQHPQWLVREGKSAEFSGDSTRFYGAEFAKALKRPPDSAFLAEGSPVTVFKGARIA